MAVILLLVVLPCLLNHANVLLLRVSICPQASHLATSLSWKALLLSVVKAPRSLKGPYMERMPPGFSTAAAPATSPCANCH